MPSRSRRARASQVSGRSSPMKIQFDAQQQYQLDAVSAVVDIFDGQPLEEPDFAVVQLREGIGLFEGHVQTEIGVGNRLAITADDLKRNVRRIQLRNEIEIGAPDAALETWPLLGSSGEFVRYCHH